MKYNRTYNFSAGPAMMPEPVLEEIRDEMMNYRGSGMSVMEMSHRSKVKSSSPLPPRTRTTATSPTAPILTFPRMPTMSTSARMRPSTV